MSTNAIDVGDSVKLSVVFRNATTQALIDPTTVTLEVKRPSGTVDQYTYISSPGLVRDSQGIYHLDYVVAVDGTHYYKWRGTGNMDAVEESSFKVKTSMVG